MHGARPQAGQAAVAERLRLWLDGSQLAGCELNVGHLGAALHELRAAIAAAPPATQPLLAGFVPRLLGLVPRRGDGSVDDAALARLRTQSGADQITALGLPVAALADELEGRELPGVERTTTRKIADRLRRVVADSPHVQDDYSLRCFPVVAAAAWRALAHAIEVVTCELNSATDNPLLFPPEPLPGESPAAWRTRLAADLPACERAVVGGGNFHGHPIAAVADYLAIALAALGNACERRLAHLVDAHHSRGLPGFLTRNGGLNSGLMLAQYTAAALVAENKVLCHPASVDSVPTCANTEDWVSMGTMAARKAADVQRQVATIVAIELVAAAQALLFRPFLRPAPRVDALATLVRSRCAGGIAPNADDGDRPLHPVFAAAQACLSDPELLDLLL
ncbi:MAG: aromatic amino acid lyase [Planctomycetes bacterium]|nr:aromatic amino acid lyase [Planctomycetota bacterium]